MQNAIINTHPYFFTTNPNNLLDMVGVLVTQRSNSIVHHLAFASMSQDKDEPIKNHFVHLRAVAIDCNFTPPSCEHDLSDIYIKDQIIREIANDTLQTDLLAELERLNPSSRTSVMLKHLNQHYETKTQWLVLQMRPLLGYQHTTDRRICHKLTKGMSVPTPISTTTIVMLNQATRLV